MCLHLREIPVVPIVGPMPNLPSTFAETGIRRSKKIDCFGFVPSDFCVYYSVLNSMPRGSLCEWGSGMGVGVALAEFLGFESFGVEINASLADASRALLAEFGFAAQIATGSFFENDHRADIYFTYCWPGQMRQVEEHFLRIAAPDARLLICHGAEDIRCKMKK